MSDLDDLFTITCGRCKATSALYAWMKPEYDLNQFVCPLCGYGFRRKRKIPRKPWEPFVELVEVGK